MTIFLKTALFSLIVFLQACKDKTDQDINWSLYGSEYNNQRHSPLKQINRDNVANLKLVWTYKTGFKNSFQTNPGT